MEFIADGMLGKLTRWLRMLGHDVEYSGPMDDKELIMKAKSEHRILLTRDIELYQHAIGKGTDAFLIESPDQTANLAGLAKRFNFKLEIDMESSRCPKCNSRIELVSKMAVSEKIPSTTYLNYNEFWQCQGCRQIYWKGAHWKKIDKTLKEARKALST